MSDTDLLLHNSHNAYYRHPVGAAATDNTVYLGIDININTPIETISLRLWQENNGEKIFILSPAEENKNHYFVNIKTPHKGCLLWYYFIIKTKEKILFYGNNPEHLGGKGRIYEHVPPSFQITVYRFDAVTPTWFKHSIMYQIFPDRFYRKGNTIIAKKNAVYHADWHDQPCYYKDVDTKEIISYDFFGGNIAGIMEKLSYLKELGISVIYLNPVFESASNHHYDTGNYHKIDPILGTNEDFTALCAKAKQMGIHIIIDGVFSHTGSDSIYFNRYNNYNSIGAFQSTHSPYYDWYTFRNYPYEYDSWWGFDTLPNVNETTDSYMNFIITSENSVLKHWMNSGISGWRLDVIDELPQRFARKFYSTLKELDDNAIMIGEVWEDASNKVSYGVPREYLCGYEMDSAMNYPLRKIIIDFLLGYVPGEKTIEKLSSQKENYPLENYYAMMNLVSSHDVERIITKLGEASFYDGMPAIVQSRYQLDHMHYQLGAARSKLAALWLLTFPGVPSIYYGDEIGMQGFRDPYNRAPYDWDTPDLDLKNWFMKLTKLRNENIALRTGEILFLYASNSVIAYARCIRQGKDVFGQSADNDAYIIIINQSSTDAAALEINLHGLFYEQLEYPWQEKSPVYLENNVLKITVNSLSAVILHQVKKSHNYEPSCGILMHPTSLYSPYGIGDLGNTSFHFIDWLEKAGQHYWQILPLNPVGIENSPYQSSSVFAGNYLLISPDELVADDLLSANDIPSQDNFIRNDFAAIGRQKEALLFKAFNNFSPNEEYKKFCNGQKYWLNDYALFCVLKKNHNGTSWITWPDNIKHYPKDTLQTIANEFSQQINFVKFVQYIFFKQWSNLKLYAHSKNIKIIGDLPIFPSHDSVDVWAHQNLFNLNDDGSPRTIAGVPPDYFSSNGQLWGNPHYLWDKMAAENYHWWIERFRTLHEIVDVIRLDHFRGFAAYWAVDGTASTARIGKWLPGPGIQFFQAIEKQLGKIPIIAEDLGIITPAVEKLKTACGFPGMKVLQFELYPSEYKNIGFVCSPNNIIYTGTHDNNTTIGWIKNELSAETKAILAEHLKVAVTPEKICTALIEYAYASNARIAMIPIQDVFKLDSSARMNTPGTVGSNWLWQMGKNALTGETANFLFNLASKYKR
ncbi:4-alpha-glucanotransferase [Pectinatus sottacetonis]|uniref:4-alpha-glucanotransferase n=1 Tax=Pectinatus sottacetonis TaxID=1002795 RepID=UPI0018C5A392|nr:4-alpha-glucanotransferase [Pectinatus sottacetonis]